MLRRQIDARTGLSRMAAGARTDRRAAGRVHHRLRDVLAQRLYGLCCGYEDLNDHDTLRADLLMQTAVGRDQPLASSPTLSRLETGATRADAWALHQVLVEHFIANFRSEEHTSELQSLMRISYAVFCLKKKKKHINEQQDLK